MKNIVSTDDSVKRQITDSISENLTDSDLESSLMGLLIKIGDTPEQNHDPINKIYTNILDCDKTN